MAESTSATPAGEPRKFELPPGYDGLAEARRLLRSIRAGSLATLDASGAPLNLSRMRLRSLRHAISRLRWLP